MTELDDILTVAEAAEVLGVSTDAVRAAARRGTLRTRTIGSGAHSLLVTTRADVDLYAAYRSHWWLRRRHGKTQRWMKADDPAVRKESRS